MEYPRIEPWRPDMEYQTEPDTPANNLILALDDFNKRRNEKDEKSRVIEDLSQENIKLANEIIGKYKSVIEDLFVLVGIMDGSVHAPFDKKLNLIQSQFEMIAELENQRSRI